MDDPRHPAPSETEQDNSLDDSFPASDPPATSSPTRSVVADEKPLRQPADGG